jgi:hypothetical protein
MKKLESECLQKETALVIRFSPLVSTFVNETSERLGYVAEDCLTEVGIANFFFESANR